MQPIVEVLAAAGECDPEKIAGVLRETGPAGMPIMDSLLDRAGLDEEAFPSRLAAQLGWSWQSTLTPDAESAAELRRACPARIALRHRLLPLKLETENGAETEVVSGTPSKDKKPQAIVMACYDPFDLQARQSVARVTATPVHWLMAPRREVLRAIQDFYGVGADTFEDILKNRDSDMDDSHLRDEANVIDADNAEASVVKFVNQIIREALGQRATDIHLEPVHDNLRIRYRVDGVLHEVPVPDNLRALQSSVLARVKVMAKLDIAEKRLPQDGRISLKLDNQNIDVRVATIPSVEGESISLRLLGQEKFTLDRLGLIPEYQSKVQQLLAKPNGIVLVTGPTGSGKSTTLYTFLSQLNSINRRIVTIEDPVENKLPGVVQIAVKPEINLTFANGLRSILRGDPNVVMIGEIRDLETAEIAVRASLTGHLVFSTLHTNDAIGAINRLVDMGVEPFLVSSAVRAFIGQRLVRTLCPHCKQEGHYSKEQLLSCGLSNPDHKPIYTTSANGCVSCRGTGYFGRLAIYEIATVTVPMQDLISQKAASNALQRQARQDGFISMREYGWRKVLEGVTTVEEVMRVTSEDFLE
jgi:type II secretory ATPase GspE/PulE/Tfp pilus assembly ATPase PilB-like protein